MVVANDPSDTDGATEADKFEETGWRWGGGGGGGGGYQAATAQINWQQRENIFKGETSKVID